MTTLSAAFPTHLDLRNRMDPMGRIAQIVEILNLQNEILNDIVWIEANNITGHQTTIRSGLPAPTWKRLNYGVQPVKSTTVAITDAIGHLFQVAEVDKDLAELNGLKAEWMLSEHLPFLEAMNQEFASTLFYGNEGTDPAEFTGLSPRFNDQSAENGGNILTSAATPDSTDNTSIWLVGWGPNTVHGIYPKGSQAGLSDQDFGLVALENQGGTGLRGQGYRRDYSWKCGLTVRDWRYVVRINYDLEDVIASAATGPDLIALMSQAIRRIPALGLCRPVFYGNRDSLDAIDKQMNYTGRVHYQTVKDSAGQEVEAFRGIPLRRCDAILSSEAGI
jgi:hypothetical protein